MYPLNEAQPYPFEQWWIAAYDHEVSRQIIGRTLLGQRVILFRTEAGEPVALAGYCPHRNYPMEKGCLVGEGVQCGYHGFIFRPDGSCARIPSQATVPDKIAIRRYPVVERGGLVWLWTGNPDAADPALLPDMEAMGLGSTGWAVEQHPLATLAGRYTLLIDNLLDLSHASFIHADTIPNGGAVAEIPVEIVDQPESLNARRTGRGMASNPLLQMLFPHHDGAVDQCFDAEYFGPNLIRTGGAITEAETGTMLGTTNFIHGITPETEGSVHYFVMTTRDFALDNESLGQMNRSMGQQIQPQDRDAVESIELLLQAMEHAPHEVSCRADTAALKVRHRLAQQIRSEIEARQDTTRPSIAVPL